MAEPFSTVAAAISLAGTVLKISKATKHFIDGIQGAPRSVEALSGYISNLLNILETLEKFLLSLDGRRYPEQARIVHILQSPLENCKDALNDIENELTPFVKSAKGTKMSKWKKVLWSAYREKDVLALQRILQSSQHSLDSAVLVVNFASSANDLKALERKVDGHENASIADSSFLGSDAVVSDCGYAMRKFLLEAETVYESASNVGSAAEPKQENLEVCHEKINRGRPIDSFNKRAPSMKRWSTTAAMPEEDHERKATRGPIINRDPITTPETEKPLLRLSATEPEETISQFYSGPNSDVWGRLESWHLLEEDPVEARRRFRTLVRLMELVSERVRGYPDTSGLRKEQTQAIQEKMMEENQAVKTIENELHLGQVRQAIESRYQDYINKKPLEEATIMETPRTPLRSYQIAAADVDPSSPDMVELSSLDAIPNTKSSSAEPNPFAHPIGFGAFRPPPNLPEAELIEESLHATDAEGHVSLPAHEAEGWFDTNDFYANIAKPWPALKASLEAMDSIIKTCEHSSYERKSERSDSQDEIPVEAPLLASAARPMGQTYAESATGGDLATGLSYVTANPSLSTRKDGSEIVISTRSGKDKPKSQTQTSCTVPEESREITIPAGRGKHTSKAKTQTDLLMEYFEGSKRHFGPGVRVKLSRSAGRKMKDTNKTYKPSFKRRISLGPHTPREEHVTESNAETAISTPEIYVYESAERDRTAKAAENRGEGLNKCSGEYFADHQDSPTTMDMVPKVRSRSSEGGEPKRVHGRQLQAHDSATIRLNHLSTAKSTTTDGSDEARSSSKDDLFSLEENRIRGFHIVTQAEVMAIERLMESRRMAGVIF